MEKWEVENKIVDHIEDLDWQISQVKDGTNKAIMRQAKSTALLALAQLVGKE